MSELKCPFCQWELSQDNPQSIECRNDDCKKSYFMYGSKELWQELIRTRKALDVATGFIKQVEDGERLDDFGICEDASEALTKITALEQEGK